MSDHGRTLRWVWTLALAVAALYVGACALVYAASRALTFAPTILSAEHAQAFARRAQLVPWDDARGDRVGWFRPRPHARVRLVVFHGNAGTALDRVFYAESFAADAEVWLFEYPGYGDRPGAPSREAFLASAAAALDALAAADPRPLYLFGESIGSGTAAELAGRFPEQVAGVVFMIPFARLADVAARLVRALPARWLLRDDFDNVAALRGYRGPIVVVVAERDEVVGADEGRRLHETYAGPKTLVMMPGAGHNDFPIGPAAPWVGAVRQALFAR